MARKHASCRISPCPTGAEDGECFGASRVSPHGRGLMGRLVCDVEKPTIKPMKTSFKRTAILILASALAVAFSAGCGTVRGFGRDVETVGENIEESAR